MDNQLWPNLTEQVKRLADALSEIRNNISERLLMMILRDATHLPSKIIRRVLDALPNLEKRYLRKG